MDKDLTFSEVVDLLAGWVGCHVGVTVAHVPGYGPVVRFAGPLNRGIEPTVATLAAIAEVRAAAGLECAVAVRDVFYFSIGPESPEGCSWFALNDAEFKRAESDESGGVITVYAAGGLVVVVHLSSPGVT